MTLKLLKVNTDGAIGNGHSDTGGQEMTEPPHSPGGHALGGTTIDLTPAKAWYEEPFAEEHIQARGRWLTILGIVTGAMTLLIAVIWRAGFGEHMPAAYVVPLYAIALAGLSLGCMEYLHRPTRRALLRSMQRSDRIEASITELVGLMSEELQQKFYRGAAWQARGQFHFETGTENARRIKHHNTSTGNGTGDVVKLRAPRPRP